MNKSINESVRLDEHHSEANDLQQEQNETLESNRELDLMLKQILPKIPEEALVGELEHRLSDSGKSKKIMQRMVMMSREHHSGPLPHPKILSGYEDIFKGAADRVICLAEKEQEHRHSIEHKAVDGAISKDRRGQNYALIVSMTIIVGSMGLIYTGHTISGMALVLTSLAGLAYTFISGRREANDNNENANSKNESENAEGKPVEHLESDNK